MKKLFAVLLLLLIGMAAHAAEVYVVKGKNVNMRAKPSGSAKKVGSLYQGQSVKVDTVIGDWATCLNEGGEKYYVSAKLLQKKAEARAEKQEELNKEYGVPPTWTLQQKIRRVLAEIGIEVKPNPSKEPFMWAMVLPMFAIAIVLLAFFIIKLVVNESWGYLIAVWLSVIAAGVMSMLELWGIIMYDGDPAWFCDISSNVMTIVFWLVLMGILVYMQAHILIRINSLGVNVSSDDELWDFLGPVSTYVCAGLYLLFYLFLSWLQPFVVLLFLICQVVHLILQFIRLENKSVMWMALFCIESLFYILIAVSTFLLIIMTIAHIVYLATNVSIWWYLGALLVLGGGGGGKYLGQVTINGITYDVYSK